jgi:Uncharacterized protein conserved in bacteria (DUF2219)
MPQTFRKSPSQPFPNAAFRFASLLWGFSLTAYGGDAAEAQWKDECQYEAIYSAPQSATTTWENDALGIGRTTDEYYTQGMRLAYTYAVPGPMHGNTVRSADDSELNTLLSSWNRVLCRHRPKWADPANGVSVFRSQTVFFGQHMFTPENIALPNPPLDDRPYAAWLYIGARLSSIVASERAALYEDFEFQVGMVGPPAQGKWVQTQFHKLIGAQQPQGWSTQLPAEPGFFASYGMQWRTRPASVWDSSLLKWDALPSGELAVGTIQTYLQAGFSLRVGRNLSGAIQPVLTPTVLLNNLPNTPAVATSDLEAVHRDPILSYRDRANSTQWIAGQDDEGECFALLRIIECGVNLGFSGRLVARNEFLDGTLFSDSRSVHKEPAYYDLTAGFKLRWSKFTLDYQFVRRSNEFTPVPVVSINRDGHHDYGSLTGHCQADATIWCPIFVGTILLLMATK